MTFSRLFLRLLDTLVVLGVLAYSVAEEDLIYAAIALPLVVVAAIVTGGPGGKPLPRLVVNSALIIATGHMAISWYSNLGETIGILCRYVIWLQLIKMFEPRTPRDQAQVIILSTVLVIGACLTSVKADLGGVLLLYIPTLLATVVVFQIFAGQVGVGPAIAAGRRPGADLRRVLVASGVLLIMVAIGVFIITPRGLGESVVGAWRGPVPKQVIGFRDHVQLGAQGLLTESRHIVMEMRVEASDQEGPYTRQLLLRGAVLDEYDPAKRIWRRSESLATGRRHELWKPDHVFAPSDQDGPYLTQRIMAIEQPSELFAAWRPIWASFEGAPKSVRYQRYDEAGLFDIRLTTWTGEYRYTVISSPSSPIPLREIEPRYNEPPLGRRFLRRRGSEQWYSVRAVPLTSARPGADAPPNNVFREGRVRELAERILAERGIDLSDDELQVRELAAAAFRHYLQQNYTYTTIMVAPLADEDPIDMFLFDTGPDGRGGKGHCEYFSSAFAAMCLSVGIPARVVTGYAATEVDPVSGLYVIRQNHAHAWADVELAPGRWREFDPSPSADVQRLHQPPSGLLASIQRAIDTLQFAWIRSVVSFDRSSQVDALSTASRTPAMAISSLNQWIAERLANEPAEDGQESPTISAARVFASVLVASTLLALVFFVLIARGGAVIRLACRLFHVRPPRIIDRLADPGARELGRLRRRMEERLKRAGMARAPATPPLAHASSLAEHDEALARDATRLTRLYYEARFGGVPPDRAILEEARTLLRSTSGRMRQVAPRSR